MRFMPNVSSTQISMLAAMPAPMGQAAAKAINGSVASSTGRIPRVRCMRTVFWYAVATGVITGQGRCLRGISAIGRIILGLVEIWGGPCVVCLRADGLEPGCGLHGAHGLSRRFEGWCGRKWGGRLRPGHRRRMLGVPLPGKALLG